MKVPERCRRLQANPLTAGGEWAAVCRHSPPAVISQGSTRLKEALQDTVSVRVKVQVRVRLTVVEPPPDFSDPKERRFNLAKCWRKGSSRGEV